MMEKSWEQKYRELAMSSAIEGDEWIKDPINHDDACLRAATFREFFGDLKYLLGLFEQKNP